MEIQEIQLSKIRPSQFQTRLAFDVDDLAASIEAQGVLEPVIVRPRTKTTYELVAGERRTRAAKQAGLEAVPAIVRELTDADALEVTVTENLQRDDLHPLEEAAGTDLLLNRDGWGPAEVAAQIGRPASFVARRARAAFMRARARAGAWKRFQGPDRRAFQRIVFPEGVPVREATVLKPPKDPVFSTLRVIERGEIESGGLISASLKRWRASRGNASVAGGQGRGRAR